MSRFQPDRPDKCRQCGMGARAKVHQDPSRHGYHVFLVTTWPWTVTLEVTIQAHGEADALLEGEQILDFVCSGFDGAAGAVVKAEVNR